MVQLFLTIFMIVTYALAAAILTYVSICSIEDSKDQQQFETIAKSIEEQNEDGDTDTTNKVYDLMLRNKDCVGWLKIVDMDVNYPVMLTKQNPEFYLRRDFNKEYSYIGPPFMDANCNIGISKNLIIYGHNMKNGRMFAPLMKFKNKECFDKHQIIVYVLLKLRLMIHGIRLLKIRVNPSTTKELRSYTQNRCITQIMNLVAMMSF